MKRANGTGTITKKTGRTLPYLVYAAASRDESGVSRHYLGSFRTKGEAQKFLETYNQNPCGERFKMTFNAVWEEFKGGKKYLKLSKSSKEGYAAAYKKCAPLHSKRFSELRTPQLQNIIDQMEDDGASGSAMHKVKILLNLLYKHAIDSDVCAKNYSSNIVLPDTEVNERRSLSDTEIKIISEAAQTDDRAKLFLYLLYSGWRISEMLELTIFNYNAAEKYFQGGKKTENGKNRIVPVHPTVQPIVEYFISKRGKTVFCRYDGEAMTPYYFRQFVLAPFLKEYNLDEKITPHYARHTFATKLKEHGADEFYRRCLLGHSQRDITDKVYTHENLEDLRKNILLFEKKKEEYQEVSECKNDTKSLA